MAEAMMSSTCSVAFRESNKVSVWVSASMTLVRSSLSIIVGMKSPMLSKLATSLQRHDRQ